MPIFRLLKRHFSPQHCCICQEPLFGRENVLCLHCSALISSNLASDDTNGSTARLFWGIAPIMRGGSLLAYQPDEPVSNILVSIKYKGHAQVCRQLGKAAACVFLTRQFFDGIDIMVPIPLSRERFQKRGYNQSEEIALGIQEITGIAVEAGSVRRIVDNHTQTHLTMTERMTNVEGIFRVERPEVLQGRHILVVDDIVTTGATVGELIRTISAAVPDVSFSILALGRGSLPSFSI